MKFSLLVACILGVALYVPHHMISAIYVPPEMMPAGDPAEGTNHADAQTRSLGGDARGSNRQDPPQPSGQAEVNPLVISLPDPAAAAPVAVADPAVVLVPAVPAAPAVPNGPNGAAPVLVPFGDDDDDDDDD